MKKFLSALFAGVLLISGCGGNETAEPVEVSVSAAASLTDAKSFAELRLISKQRFIDELEVP